MYSVILLKFHIISFSLFPVNLWVQLPPAFPVGILSGLLVAFIVSFSFCILCWSIFNY